MSEDKVKITERKEHVWLPSEPVMNGKIERSVSGKWSLSVTVERAPNPRQLGILADHGLHAMESALDAHLVRGKLNELAEVEQEIERTTVELEAINSNVEAAARTLADLQVQIEQLDKQDPDLVE